MATLRVRFRDATEEEWSIRETMQLKDFGTALHNVMHPGGGISFAVDGKSDAVHDFAMVFLRMDDVMMWELDGFVDDERLASWWQPLEAQ